MPYTKQGPFVNGGPPGISAAVLDAFDNGIASAVADPILVQQFVAAQQNSSSTVYVGASSAPAVAFVGPAGGKIRIDWSAQMWRSTVNGIVLLSLRVRTGGVDVLAASDDRAVLGMSPSTTNGPTVSNVLVFDVNAGVSYTVELMHRTTGDSATWANRRLLVTALGG